MSENSAIVFKIMIKNSSGIIFLLLVLFELAFGQTDSLRLEWNPNPEPDLAYYYLYRSLGDSSQFRLLKKIDHPLTYFVDTDHIMPGFRYFYKISAVDTAGNRSEFSEIVSAGIPQINWTIDKLPSNRISEISFHGLFYDPGDSPENLSVSVSEEDHITVSTSDHYLLIEPSPADHIGAASFLLKAEDSDGFRDEERVTVEFTEELTSIFSLSFPNIHLPAGGAYKMWLDSCVSVVSYSPQEISWRFLGLDHVSVDFIPATRIAEIRSNDPDWTGLDTVIFKATLPNSDSRSARVVVAVGNLQQTELNVYPNPCRLFEGQDMITFDNIPAEAARITIYSSSGSLVLSHDLTEDEFQWRWPVKNGRGKQVSSGLYIYVVSGEGDRKISAGKILVIR